MGGGIPIEWSISPFYLIGLDPNKDMSLDDLFEDKTALAQELNELNRRRESFRNTLSYSPADKSGR